MNGEGEWGKPRTYLRVERWTPTGTIRGQCGECGEIVGWKGVDRCSACGTVFTEITSPFEEERAFCERLRPDLPYVVHQWV